MSADKINILEIASNYQVLFLLGRHFHNVSSRIAHETRAPEFNAPRVLTFVSHSVYGCNKNAVGDGVASLNCLPGRELRVSVLLFLGGVPADGSRIKEYLSAGEGGQARGLRIPLVPADQNSDSPVASVPGPESEVSRREVEFFVVERIVRDVHLAVFPEIGSVGVQNGRGIMIDAGRSPLEQRGDKNDLQFARKGSQKLRGRSWDLLSQFEIQMLLGLAEVRRFEQLGQTDDLSALVSRLADSCHSSFQIKFGLFNR